MKSTTRRSAPILLAAALLSAIPVSGQDGPHLTDPEIAHVAVTANAIDVDLAELAVSRASDAEVQRFARIMITDHTAVNESAAALVHRLGVSPTDNDVSRSLRRGGDDARHTLESARGSAFDRAYMEREVAYHQAVLDALDGLLIPQATNAELEDLLRGVRPAIAAHLDHARTISARLRAGSR